MSDFWTFEGIDASQPALLSPDSSVLTYGALSDAADAWTTRLREAAGHLVPMVALELATSTDAIAAYLGVLRAGLPLLIVDPGTLGSDSPLARTWRPDLNVTAGPDGVMTLSERPRWREEVTSLPSPHPDLRILLSTSGSTGEPKLVRLSAGNVSANAESIADYLHLCPSDRAVTTLPLFYSYGLSVLNSYLSVGASLVVTQQSVTDSGFWDTARAAGATSLAFVAHQFDLLRAAGFRGDELPSLRYITQAGGRLDPGTMEHFWSLGQAAGWQLFIMYGQTEAAPRISYVPPEALPRAGDTIGRAIPGGRLWLVDDDGHEINHAGIAGELVYEGPNVMMGYAFTRSDLAKGADAARLRTGDVAERTSDDYFRIVGRLKRFVKLYGLRLSLDQIEASLRSRGIIAHAVGVDEQLVLLCREAADEEVVRKIVSEDYGLPRSDIHTAQLTEVPLLPSGKEDHQALRRLATAVVERSRAAGQVITPQTSLLDVMRWATRRTDVTPSDTFVGLGGDSLSYLEVQIALDERLGAAPRGWERRTIAELEEMSEERGASRRRPRASVGIDVVLRIVAITMIVTQHATSYPVFGGAWVLLAVMGFSAARLQVEQIAGGRPVAFLVRMLYPIVPIYFVILILYALLRDDVPLRYWLLVGNYEPWTGGSLLVVYWFVSVYAQIVGLLALVAAVGPLRRLVAADPWRAAALATGLVLVVVLLLAALGNGDGLPYVSQRGLAECLTMFTIGWMLQRMDGLVRVAVSTVLTVAALTLLEMTPGVLALVLVALVLLALDVHLRLPRVWARTLNQIASTTLYVYLAHQVVVFVLSSFDLPEAGNAVLALCLSFAAALALKHGVAALDRAIVAGRRTDVVRESGVL